MKIPFSIEQFLEVFERYNVAIYPLQVLFYVIAALALFFATSTVKNGNRFISAILSFFWLWMGLVYHILFFSSINKMAYAFGALFIIQSLLFFYMGVIRNRLAFAFKKDIPGFIGVVLILYALIIYPLAGFYLGHTYPSNPSFGLPCPTTIFTFGLLLWTDKKLKIGILIIPMLWSITGISAALNLGMAEDFGLIIAAVLSFIFILLQNRNFHRPTRYSLRG